MSTFKKFYENNTAASAFGDTGATGNQFPSNNDKAYAPGDARMPKVLGIKKSKWKPGKKLQIPIQRRKLSVNG